MAQKTDMNHRTFGPSASQFTRGLLHIVKPFSYTTWKEILDLGVTMVKVSRDWNEHFLGVGIHLEVRHSPHSIRADIRDEDSFGR